MAPPTLVEALNQGRIVAFGWQHCILMILIVRNINEATRVGTVGGLQPVGTATAPNRLENFTTLNRYDDILTVVERM